MAAVTPTTAASDTGTAVPPPARVLVVGDSVAKTLGDGFDREAHAAGIELFNRGQLACGLAQRARIEHGGVWADTEPTCDDWPDQWRGWIDELQPVTSVVVFDVFVLQDLEVDGVALEFGTPESDRYLLDQLDRGVDVLRSNGSDVALVTAPYNERPITVGQPVEMERGRHHEGRPLECVAPEVHEADAKIPKSWCSTSTRSSLRRASTPTR